MVEEGEYADPAREAEKMKESVKWEVFFGELEKHIEISSGFLRDKLNVELERDIAALVEKRHKWP